MEIISSRNISIDIKVRFLLKNKLQAKSVCLGSWITIGNTSIVEILANAGFDWLVIDLEHSIISMEQAGDLIRVIDLAGTTPLVRLTSNDANQIKRVMDAGAHGIVVPMVNSKEEAEAAVAATRYAPKGNRGVGLARAQGYGASFADYLKWQSDSPLVIVQIEHKLAVENLESILSVSGVDGFIIGPYDLSCSMEIPGEFDHPEFLTVMSTIRNTARQLQCPSGLHIVEPDPEKLKQTISEGYQFIAYSVDIRMLDVSAREGISTFKEI